MGIFGAASPSRKDFVCGKPQMNTTTLRMIQGSQGRRNADCGLRIAEFDSALVPASSTRSLPLSVLTERQIVFGCQNFKNSPSAAIETIAATTSTSHGP